MIKKICNSCMCFILIAQSVLCAAAEPKLNGGFLVPVTSVGWSQAQWAAEFGYMKTLGMNTAIMAHTINGTTAYYPTSMSGFTPVATASTDFTNMMNAADAAGMEMHLGLSLDEGEWYNWWPADTSYSTKLRERSMTMIDELISLYGNHSSLKGIYFPQELDNARFVSSTNRDILVNNLLKPISDHVHAVRPDLLFSDAPFYNPTAQQPAEYQVWWTQVLNACPNFDLVIPQDGIGANPSKITFPVIASYFSALQGACNATGRKLWSDLEMFESTSNYEPPPIDRTLQQLSTEAPYVEKFVVWAWIYCSPNHSMRSLDFYCNYQRYIAGETSFLQNESAGKSYTYSVAPHASYPDAQMKTLTDGVSSLDYLGGKCVGWAGVTGNLDITLDLGAVKGNLTHFRIHVPKQQGAAVVEPAWINIAISENGSQYTALGSPTPFGIRDNTVINYQLINNNNAVTARYVRYTMPFKAWLMCTELGVYSSPAESAVGDWTLF